MAFAIKPKSTVVFIGDSITDCDRRGGSAPLGNGYVRMTSELVAARYPEHLIRFINTGIGGHTVRDLAGRFTDDAIVHQPDWLSIKIGINDLHRWMGNVANSSVSPEEFEQLYDGILARAKKETKAQIVLVDPFYISVDFDSGNWRSQVLSKLPLYINTVHKMAKKYKTRLVRTHDAFQRGLKVRPADYYCPEPVHPFASGHLLIAHEWLKTVGW